MEDQDTATSEEEVEKPAEGEEKKTDDEEGCSDCSSCSGCGH